ncbi:hypothetical protein GCM10022268_33560 [Sphingomonas cynarae]|uniref:Uncharacterized protein n=1 Tax=Sphingomonas cynarae TaxID=930197 RepID=A0ABP7ERL6_9SPHN
MVKEALHRGRLVTVVHPDNAEISSMEHARNAARCYAWYGRTRTRRRQRRHGCNRTQ